MCSGIISNGYLKLKLAFGADVCETERNKILAYWAEKITKSKVEILDSHHYVNISILFAQINHPHNAR